MAVSRRASGSTKGRRKRDAKDVYIHATEGVRVSQRWLYNRLLLRFARAQSRYVALGPLQEILASSSAELDEIP